MNQAWPKPHPPPTRDEVHLWQIPVPRPKAVLDALEQTLSDEEQHRARALLAPHAKAEFVATRAVLRRLIADYLGPGARPVAFQLGPEGKPRLADNDSALTFNASHTRDLALCAFAWEREVGVDVERHTESVDRSRLMELTCAPEEITQIRRLPEGAQDTAFYDCWAKKEAVLKAAGLGLSIPALKLLDVIPQPGSLVLRGELPPLQNSGWHVPDVPVGLGYSAAVAFHGRNATLHAFTWAW